MKRRRLVPEVVQISSTDCGPAVLKSMLEGHGISASYGRLREACQTGVDGTSINAIEALIKQAGLEASQTIVPLDHLLMEEARALPAVVVLRLPNDLTHFVVLWSRIGPYVQVMDPAIGRRWTRRERLLQEIYDFWKELPAAQWRSHAGSQTFLRPLETRMRALGIDDPRPRIDRALEDPAWRSISELDAGVRMVESLAANRGIDRGASAIALLDTLLEQSAKETLTQPSAEWTIPIAFRTVLPSPMKAGGASTQIMLGGAVAVTVRGFADDARRDLSAQPELEAALREPPPRPWRDLFGMLKAEGVLRPAVLLFTLFAAAGAALLEALLFRALFEIGDFLPLPEGRLYAGVFLALFLAGILLLELPITHELQRLGRSLEARLRRAFLEKLPKLADRYLQSRATSDMADRCHAVHRLRAGPLTAGQIVRDTFELIVTVAGLAWLDPASAIPALILAVTSVSVPIVAQPLLAERDLRTRSHLSALSRFYLDALLGLTPIRTHGAERAVRREHEMLTVDWTHAAKRSLRATITFDGVIAVISFALAAWVFMAYVGRAGEAPGTLLFLYWALNLPVLGQNIASSVRMYSPMRTVAMRLLEPLGAVESTTAEVEMPKAEARSSPAAVRFEAVEVVAGGQTILRDVDLSIRPGEHIGVVGPSGAGKSSLLGLLLGWHAPAKGAVVVDEAHLEGARLERLRTETAWVDPAVQLWNRSLLDNLLYGAEGPSGLAKTIDAADLRGVLEAMPNGLQTELGEGGALVSGGEGQRVRLARAMMRHRARLVLLDEPFRGLDRPKRCALLERARTLWSGVTMICVTHDISETLGFERVWVIDGGRIVDDGKPSELAADPKSRYRQLLDAETAVRERTWSNKQWRKIRVEDGRISNGAKEAK